MDTTPQSPAAFWGDQFADESPAPAWLWDGYLAPGNVTLFTSQWKSGKTTLIAALLARLKGPGTFAGRAVRGTRALVVSEESQSLWRARHHKLDLGHVCFLCQPCPGKPTLDEWLALLDRAAELHAADGVELLVIDTLTTFLPGRNEASAGVMMEALLPLRKLTSGGLAVLLVHHPAKGEVLTGQAARGSGALASFTDINIEMTVCRCSDAADRRRRLLTQSRHDATPLLLTLELNAAGTDYEPRPNVEEDEFTLNWTRLRGVLESATEALSRRQIAAAWPTAWRCPSDATLYRWLERAAAAGFLCRNGTGRRADPFRYRLPERARDGGRPADESGE